MLPEVAPKRHSFSSEKIANSDLQAASSTVADMVKSNRSTGNCDNAGCSLELGFRSDGGGLYRQHRDRPVPGAPPERYRSRASRCPWHSARSIFPRTRLVCCCSLRAQLRSPVRLFRTGSSRVASFTQVCQLHVANEACHHRSFVPSCSKVTTVQKI